MSDRPGLWFPLVLLAALAALTTWLDLEVRNAMTEAALRGRHDPDTILHTFTTRQTGRSGAVETTVRARTMRRFMDDGSSEFEAPRIERRDAKGVVMDIRADRGRASGDQKTLEFEGHVLLKQTGRTRTPVTLETTFLRVLPQKNQASTDQAVRIRSADTLVTGVGLDSDFTQQTLHLRAKVKVVYQPPRHHANQINPPEPRRPDRKSDRSGPGKPSRKSRAR